MTSNELNSLQEEVSRLSSEVEALRSGSKRERRRGRTILIAGLVASLGLAIAGAAQALPGRNTVDSGDIINGQVKTKDLAANAVKGPKVRDESLTGADILNGSIKGADVDEGSLNFVSDGQCSPEAVHSWAFVDNSALTAVFAPVAFGYNCSGGAILARRVSDGQYEVRFVGDPSALGLATSVTGINNVGVLKVGDTFHLEQYNYNGVLINNDITFMTF